MNFGAGDLVRVRLQLKGGGWTLVAGQVCDILDGIIVVATVAGLRSVPTPHVAPW